MGMVKPQKEVKISQKFEAVVLISNRKMREREEIIANGYCGKVEPKKDRLGIE